MKIVHMTTVHYPFDNRIFFKECVSIAEAGHKVILIVPHVKNEVIQNVRISALPIPQNRFSRMLITTNQAYNAALHAAADVYHIHDPELLPYAWLLAKKGKQVVYDVHEDYVTAIKQKKYLAKPIRLIIAYLFSLFEQKISQSLSIVLAEKYYKNRFPDGITVLNYPKSDMLTITENTFNANKYRVIYTGNITEDRGGLLCAEIVKYCPNIEIYMIGYCKKKMAEEIFSIAGEDKERLHLKGVNRFVPFREIVDYYKKGGWVAGLAIFPPSPHYYKKELTKFFEYMSAGIPIICSNFAVWKEFIEKTGAGISVDPGDKEEIKEALEYLHNNLNVAKKMGNNGRKMVKQHYMWEHEFVKLKDLYEELTGETTD